MDVTISQKSPVLIEAEVNVAWDTIAPHYQKALNDIRQHAQLPGFRKGKAPLGMLKKRYRQEITDDITRKVIPETLESVITEKDIKAVGQPRLHHVGLKENEHFHFCVYVEVLPEVTLSDWKGIEAEKLKVVISDEDVESAIEQRLKNAEKKETITDRGIENGDQVTMALTVIDEEAGETLTDLEDYQIVPGDEGAHPIISELIQGLEREAMTSKTFDAGEDESHFEAWAGKTLKAHIEIKDVSRTSQPELNDDFAKEQGAENVDDWRQKVRADLEKQAEDRETMEAQTRIIRKLMEGYDFEVPGTLVNEEARNQVQQQLMPYIQMMGEQFLDDKLLGNMLEAAKPQAAFKVRTDLVLEKVAETEGLEVSDEELDQELEQYVEAFKAKSLDDLKSQYQERGLIEGVGNVIKRRKALDAIVEAAKIENVDQLSESASKDAAAEAQETPAEAADEAPSEADASKAESEA